MERIVTYRKARAKGLRREGTVGPRSRRDREVSPARQQVPEIGTYCVVVVPESVPIDLRRVRFGRLTTKLIADARDKGMTIGQIEKATDVSWTTIDRWMKGDWNRDPRGTQVKSFVVGLGGSVTDFYAALGWSQDELRTEPEPPLDPRLRAIARRLSDPNVSTLEKIAIQAQLDYILRGKLPHQD